MLRTISCFVSLVISVCMFSYQSFGQTPTGYLSVNTTSICSGMPTYFTVSLSGTAPWSIVLRIDHAPGTLPQYETIDLISENTYTFTRFLSTTSTYAIVSISDKNNTMMEYLGSSIKVNVQAIITSSLQDDLIISGVNPINCQSGETTLSASSGIYHQWYKNDVYISTKSDLSQLNITSLGSGSYSVTTTDNTCIQKKSKKIVVNTVTNSLKPIVSGDSVISCDKSNVILSATLGFSRYDWKKDNQLVQSSSGNTVDANLYGEGKYTVTAFSTVNCSSTSDQFTVKYAYPFERPFISPSMPFGKNFITCLKNTNIFSGPNGFQKYEWWVNGKLKQSGNSNSFDANNLGSGIYYVILTVYNSNNCFRSSDGFNLILSDNLINPTISHSSSFICPDAPVQLSVSPDFTSCSWSNGSTENTIFVNQSGKYSVTVGSGGCINTAFDIITEPNSIQSTTIVSNITTGRECFPNSITLTTSTNISQYLPVWYKDGNYFSGAYPLYANTSGSYELKLIPKYNNTSAICYTKSNKIDAFITQPPVQVIGNTCQSTSYTHTVNGAMNNQVYKWYSDATSTTPLYISSSSSNNKFSSSLSSIYVSIYDQISGCETPRANMYYLIDPIKLTDKIVNVCTDGSANPVVLATDDYAGGTYKWYIVPTGGTPIYTSSLNSYTISKPTEDKIYYVEFISARGCITTRAKITVSVLQPPVLSVISSFCQGYIAAMSASPITGVSYYWYDSPTSQSILSTNSDCRVMVSDSKTYYASAVKNGCVTIRSSIAVNAVPVPTSTFLITSICDQSATILYTGNAVSSDTYTWNFDGATIISGNGAGPYKVRWSVPGTRLVSLQVNRVECYSNTTYQNFVVPSLPDFSVPATTYCQNETPIALTGTPTGGVFSGTGISGSAYTPSTTGINTITYTYTNPADACVYTAVKTVTVNPLPAVSIAGLNTSYCQSSTGIPVTVSPAGGTLSGTGISGTTFTPSTQGQRTISYTYKDANNCSNTTTQSVTVNPVPTASFTGLDAAYCQNSPASVLTGSPAGGTFSGDGISGNTFTPTKTGTNTITYTYQPNGCGIPAVKTTMVSAQIIPAITVSSSVPLATCGQSVTYTAALTNINTPVLQWYYNGLLVGGATSLTCTINVVYGDRVSCKVKFTDICQKVPVELMAAVYEQSVVVPTTNYLKLDGTDDKVTIPVNTAYDLGNGDFTLEAFVMVDVRSTVPTPIVSKRTAAQGFVLYLNDNTLTLKIGSTVYTSSTFTSIKDQYLHQVGVSRQNGVITFYLDGRTIGTAGSTLSINSTANLLLGSDAVDASYMKGYIQNVNFSSLANDFTSNAGLQIAPRSSVGIIGSWYMTGCSGQTYVKDYSLVSNNAYLGAVLGSESSDPVYSNPPVVILYNPNLNLNTVSFASEANNSKHIEIPNNGAYGAFNSNFTIEAIVQGANAGVNSYPTILSKRSASTNGLAIGVNNGKVFVSLGSNIFYDNGSYNLNNNNCNHIALVGQKILNKTFFYVFVNGVQTYSSASSGYFNTSDPIWIGNDRGTANVFNASIDEIRIWNSARTPDQISANRNTVFNSSTPNLIGYYRFKENINSQVVTDESSLGNPGFLGNSTALDINDPIRVNLTCSSNSRTTSLEELPEPENIETTEAQAPSILLYPNPFGTNCRLQIQHATGEVTIHVMDAAGNVVFVKEKHPVIEELIFGDELPQGMYILQCMGRPELKPIKFIKTK